MPKDEYGEMRLEPDIPRDGLVSRAAIMALQQNPLHPHSSPATRVLIPGPEVGGRRRSAGLVQQIRATGRTSVRA